MREIKFRAWMDYGNHAEMIYNIQNHITGNWAFGYLIQNRVEGVNVSVMQFTGLKDSNGVEIYEGDVVYLAGYGLYEVEFPFTEPYDSVMENDIGEIKGNIHENPELLND